MSRLKNFSRNLTASYLLLVVNAVCSLISIRVALHWLPTAEFGLWAVLIQLIGYISLVDLGMTSAVARLLVDQKDQRQVDGYGSLIKTAFLVSLAQGIIIFLIIQTFTPLLASIMKIQAGYEHTFINLMRWQGLISGLAFTLRPLAQILYAHQRADLTAFNDMASLICQMVTLWIFLALGKGIYSFIYAGAAYGFIGPTVLFWHCHRLRFFPEKDQRGHASWQIFQEMFAYGKDVFLMGLGYQLTMASQTIIVSRTLGLDVAAAWAIGTKMFNMTIPLMCRPFGASLPGLYEMLSRNETGRLRHRFKDMVVLTASLGAFLGVAYALCNSLFIHVWFGEKIAWSPMNDVLLGGWVFLISLTTTHANFVTVTKQIGGMRYVFFLEGCCFVLLASLLGSHWGLPGVVTTSLVCTVLFSGAYSFHRSRIYFHCGWSELCWSWVRPSWQLLLILVPLAAILWFMGRGLPPGWRLAINGLLTAVVGGGLFLRLGLPPGLILDLGNRLPRPASRLLKFFKPCKS
jgi:O-antigen/teichoic acid export membrane protein